MPGKIKVKVLAGRNLPVMDRASDTTDAFVEIKFGSVTHKTDVCRKSLNPHWNSTEWYRFEVDESELQDEPLQLRLMDHDTYSANDAIGKVVISLAPLLAREAINVKNTAAPPGGAVMSGWIPVFDTMHGIRGELNVIVKVELFSDFNKYKTSSCGVQFFHCSMIPPGYRATAVHGFVEELVVNDDPEYQWIDKIRTPRASNEARQVAFIKLSNQVQRLVGLKAAELGANAVVGYQQDFDLEGEAGVVARAIGTAVTINPLPTPCQPMNLPTCTQQQLKKYLDILATDNESMSDMNEYYQTHQAELQKMLVILNPNASSLLDETDAVDEDDKSMEMTRQYSVTSYPGNVSIYQDEYNLHHKSLRHLSEDQTDLNRLLNKDSDDSDSSGPLQKIKKIKTNFFSKKFRNIRSKKSSTSDKQDDQISLRSNSSETSRLSLVDIKNEFKKLKRMKKPKLRKQFVNEGDEGEGMASILARSVIHAHTSLACIAETQDSEPSPGSTMRRTSESEPTINKSDEDKIKRDMGKVIEDVQPPEIRFTSLNNISSEESPPGQERQRKLSESCPTTPIPNRSENLLKLPGEAGYFGSISSALSADSSEIESSSDEDDESSDLRTDTERSIETTSSVVQSVLNHNVNTNLMNQQIDRKISILKNEHPDFNVAKEEVKINQEEAIKPDYDKKLEVEKQVFDSQIPIDKCKSLESVPREMEFKDTQKPVKSNEASTSSVKDEKCVVKPSHHIKFHNPFAHKKASKSISAPSSPVEKSSFVHRSSTRIKRQLSKLSKNSMIKSFSHYSLSPKKKESKAPLSHPSSSSDFESKAPSETVLGSPFLSYNDLISLDKEGIEANKVFHKSDEFERAKVSMYIGSEPVSRASLSLSGSLCPYPTHKEDIQDHLKKCALKPIGLVHTAMETILLDKVQSLLIPTSPDPESKTNKQFFDDVTEKLGKVEQDRNSRSTEHTGYSVYQRFVSRPQSHSPPGNNKPCIINSATIYKSKINKHNIESSGMVKTAMEAMLMDRAQSAIAATTPELPKPEFEFRNDEFENKEESKSRIKKPLGIISSFLGSKPPRSPEPASPTEKIFKKKELKPAGIVHTAMEAMLMERVQSVLPETPQPTSIFEDYDRERYEESRRKYEKPTGLVQTAFETMLLDRVQTSALGVNVEPVISDTLEDEKDKTNVAKDFTHMAMEAMLLDRIQTSALGTNIDPVITTEEENEKKIVKDEEVKGLTHMAMETMLLDRVQSSALGANVDAVIHIEDSMEKENVEEIKNNESKGLTHMAMETMLLDRVQTSALGANVNATILDNLEPDNMSVKSKDVIKTDEVSGLTHMAIETMLIDRVQTLGASVDPIIENFENENQSMKSKNIITDDEAKSLTHMAMGTMLLDRVQASALGSKVDPLLPNNLQDDNQSVKSKDIIIGEKVKGLTHMAMETMLLDRVQASVLGSEVDPVLSNNLQDDNKSVKSKDIIKGEKVKGLTHMAMETMLLDRVQASALGANVDPVILDNLENDKQSINYKENVKSDETKGLTHMAMETMLLDRVQVSALGANVNPIVNNNKEDGTEGNLEKAKSSSNDLRPSGLVDTAIKTILLDKVQSSVLGAQTPAPVIADEMTDLKRVNVSASNLENASLTHTAMETILMDKVHSLCGQPGMTFVEPKHFSDNEIDEAEKNKEDLKSPRLVKSAVQTILLDKVQSLVGQNEFSFEQPKEFKSSTENIPNKYTVTKQSVDECQTNIKTNKSVSASHPPGMIKTALQTVLVDKAQSQLPESDDETPTKIKSKIESVEQKNEKKLVRQDSVHSTIDETPKMSKVANTISSDVTKSYHPLLGELETIPSLPEGSIDVEETNNSVCDNSHAVCRVNRDRERREERREREKEKEEREKDRGSPRHARHESYGGREPVPTAHVQNSSLNASSTPMGIHRRSSDSDLSVTPKGNSLNTSAGNVGSGGGAILRPSMNSNNLDMLEYPFLTMTEFPPGFIVHIGGTVCARSVKLADGGEGAARAAWWAELRTELRAHARALRCNAVIAYSDTTSICEDVCVLSASGTAAVINLDCDFNVDIDAPITVNSGSKNAIDELENDACSVAHVPYSPGTGPYRAELSSCGGCRRARVPTVLLATCAKPSRLVSHAKAVTLTAVAARVRRAPPTSEPGARDISDQLPFLEYELHKLLLAKLRMQGANALFSLQTQIAIGERCVMALASGTALRLAALPPPAPPRIKASEKDKDALEIQKALWESFTANRAANGYDIGGIEHNPNGVLPEVEGEDLGAPALDLCADKDACVLELDETEDVETARALAKRHVNMQVYTPGLKPIIGAPPHAFTQVWRGRLVLAAGAASTAGEKHVRRALDGVAYKLRRLSPAALALPRFQLELPDDEIQLVVSGAAIPLQDPNTPDTNGVDNGLSQQGNGNGDHDDDIFTLDEEQLVKPAPEVIEDKVITGQAPNVVSVSSLPQVSGGRGARRVCALRLLFVRETTAVRELGGLSGFLHTFTCEVLAIMRAYTAALGGNALTSFYITQLMLQDNAHKNQGQCLLSVGGDVVHVTY